MSRGEVARGEVLGQRIAGVPRTFLKVPALSAQSDLLDGQRNVALAAELLHERLVQLGVRAERVIDVERGDGCAETVRDVQQRHGVPATRHHHEQRLALTHESALACRL